MSSLSCHFRSQGKMDRPWQRREKGKPSGNKGKRGKVEHQVLGSFPLGNGHRAYACTNETKRFPGHGGKALAALTPPNLRPQKSSFGPETCGIGPRVWFLASGFCLLRLGEPSGGKWGKPEGRPTVTALKSLYGNPLEVPKGIPS